MGAGSIGIRPRMQRNTSKAKKKADAKRREASAQPKPAQPLPARPVRADPPAARHAVDSGAGDGDAAAANRGSPANDDLDRDQAMAAVANLVELADLARQRAQVGAGEQRQPAAPPPPPPLRPSPQPPDSQQLLAMPQPVAVTSQPLSAAPGVHHQPASSVLQEPALPARHSARCPPSPSGRDEHRGAQLVEQQSALATFCHQPQMGAAPGCGVLPTALDPADARRFARRGSLSTLPPVQVELGQLTVPASMPKRKRQKGLMHAQAVPGPWVGVLASMPAPPQTVAARIRAGTAEQDTTHDDTLIIKHERAARALVSILPLGSAEFVLRDSKALIASRPPLETGELMVDALKPFGVGSLNIAYSAYGRLLTWVYEKFPHVTVLEGSHFTAFCKAKPLSQSTADAFKWLRDHVGLDLPIRAPCSKPHVRAPPVDEHEKRTFELAIMLALEDLSVNGETEFTRGHAAAYWFLGKARLRFEQSRNFVINAVVPHEYLGAPFRIASCAVVCEKHPNPAERKPRPLWLCVEGAIHPDGPLDALDHMLGRAPACRSIFLETDGKGGDPTSATRWVHVPIEEASRAEASLRSLLILAGMTTETAGTYHPHSAKRFMMNLAEASPYLDKEDSLELMDSSLSTSKRASLRPSEELLRAHTIRASVLPRRYAGSEVVKGIFDRLARAELEICRAADAMSATAEAHPELDIDLETGFQFLKSPAPAVPVLQAMSDQSAVLALPPPEA